MGIFDDFIRGSESDAVGFRIVNKANPLEWGNLASAIIGSIAAGAASAAIAIPNGIAEAFQIVYRGAATAVENMVEAVFEPFVTVPLGIPRWGSQFIDPLNPRFVGAAMARIWGVAYVEEFGLLAGPIAAAFVLAAAGIVLLGARQAINTFRSGGGIL